LFALGQAATTPNILAIASVPGQPFSCKLVNITAEGTSEIGDLKGGAVLFGVDDSAAAFLKTPADGPGSGSRLLVVDRNSGAVIADRIVKGFQPIMLKATIVGDLAVCSKTSRVYFPLEEFPITNLMEMNWTNGAARRVALPYVENPGPYIYGLSSTPAGVVADRGVYFDIFDPVTQSNVTHLDQSSGYDRVTHKLPGRFYVVPGYGIVESVRDQAMFRRRTEKDFSTPSSTNEFATQQINEDKNGLRIAWTTLGKPCLVWGEHDDADTGSREITKIVVFDLEARRVLLRKELGGGFSSQLLPDRAGKRIYFFDAAGVKIFYLDAESEQIHLFATPRDLKIGACVAVN
jgi:hypothetical protein